jgi:hypothetical protein
VTDGDRALILVSGAPASGDKMALADAFSQARGITEDSEVEEVLLDVALSEAERFLDDEGRRSAAVLWERVQKVAE